MKPLLFALLAASLAVGTVAAPAPLAAQEVLSVHAGGVRSTFARVYGYRSFYAISGSSVRAAMTVPLTGPLAIQLAVSHTGKGAASGLGDAEASQEMRLSLLEFHTLLKASTAPGRSVSAHLLWGASVASVVKCTTGDLGDPDETDCSDNGLIVSPTDIGASFGVGVEAAITDRRYKICLDMLKTISLFDLHADSWGEVRNTSFTYTLGFGVPVG
ncbi:MAG: hypothetical protein J4F34_06335 [Gemmatimonadetes bacterium]|nr:hypothetical protein [Gemmatimonadota bacterium]